MFGKKNKSKQAPVEPQFGQPSTQSDEPQLGSLGAPHAAPPRASNAPQLNGAGEGQQPVRRQLPQVQSRVQSQAQNGQLGGMSRQAPPVGQQPSAPQQQIQCEEPILQPQAAVRAPDAAPTNHQRREPQLGRAEPTLAAQAPADHIQMTGRDVPLDEPRGKKRRNKRGGGRGGDGYSRPPKKKKRFSIWKLFGWLFGLGFATGVAGLIAVIVIVNEMSKELPTLQTLEEYSPKITSRVHAANGALLAEFAREKRLFQPIETIPDQMIQAFLSAEDKNFFNHNGISFRGLARAMVNNVRRRLQGVGGPLEGASTITQQVAKNFLLSSEQRIERKVKEALLAVRIEEAFEKEEILELYLNEIFFGLNSHGVAAASLNYFNKAVHQLSLAETAYLAALPKGPNNYHPFRRPDRAIERRNWVIDRMVVNGYVSEQQAEVAKNEPLNVKGRRTGTRILSAEYFAEEVRRRLGSRYGEDTLYGGGLSVRTTLEPVLQQRGREALINGLVAFDRELGFRGAVEKIELGEDWGVPLAKVSKLSDLPEWRLAVILSVSQNEAQIGLRPASSSATGLDPARDTGTIDLKSSEWAKKDIKSLNEIFEVGDVIYVQEASNDAGQPRDGAYILRQIPAVDGALVSMDPRTGRVVALVGGFSFDASEFNRATQARRQPGSSFKPIVYAAALDNGYTPASVVLDAPLSVENIDGTTWDPNNYSGQYYGPQTLRTGIERSRNVMTVRLAQDIGMPLVSEYGKLFGVYNDLQPVLAMSLGAGETTVLQMTAAYATIANGGRRIKPTLIDRVQDRYGKTIFKHDERTCQNCDSVDWQGQDEPVIVDTREQVLDPMTAHQVTSMMQGVIDRGTARGLKDIGRPVAGKTGTTNDYKDAWFVGYTPDLVTGVYVGFDIPKSMGTEATGGSLAAPIFKEFMASALEKTPPTPFVVPEGMTNVWINPNTGVRARAGEQAIQEAFKPGTGPNLVTSVIGIDTDAFLALENQDLGGNLSAEDLGGIY